MEKLNHFIYCNFCFLKRKVSKLYMSRDGVPYVYDIDGLAWSLQDLTDNKIDYLILPKDSRRVN